ncbi:MAG: sel1 repeat family protein [Proteobacteria bacterium]|nr:sel1 repeat family protein [Pseudomonadota bacterium]
MQCRKTLLAAVLLLFAAHAHADFNDGVVALMAGKFDIALKTFVPLAETNNHAYAQYFLGRMYERGEGVEKDAKAAAKWYRKAAEKGVNDAQFRLASMYENGVGVPRDMEYAYGWYSVAVHLGSNKAVAALAHAKSAMRDDELVQADKLSRELIGKYGTVPESTSRTQ